MKVAAHQFGGDRSKSGHAGRAHDALDPKATSAATQIAREPKSRATRHRPARVLDNFQSLFGQDYIFAD